MKVDERDPLDLAKRLYRAYVTAPPAPAAPPQGEKRIVLEAGKPKRGSQGHPRAGESWNDRERMALVREYLKQGRVTSDLTSRHGRSLGALESELRKIGFTLD